MSAELSEEFKHRKEELYRAIQNECLISGTNGGLPDIDRLASVSRFHTEWAMTQATFAAKLLQKEVSRSSAAASKSRSKRLKKRRSSISTKSTASTAVITEDTRRTRSTSECKAVECQTSQLLGYKVF